jgi:hypothetical protein
MGSSNLNETVKNIQYGHQTEDFPIFIIFQLILKLKTTLDLQLQAILHFS